MQKGASLFVSRLIYYMIKIRYGAGEMTEKGRKNRLEWSMAKADLCREVLSLGFPAEFGELLAGELGSPRSMGRMTSYLRSVRPRSVEAIVDEMLAIASEAESWRQRKASQEAQASYNEWLRLRCREGDDEE